MNKIKVEKCPKCCTFQKDFELCIVTLQKVTELTSKQKIIITSPKMTGRRLSFDCLGLDCFKAYVFTVMAPLIKFIYNVFILTQTSFYSS